MKIVIATNNHHKVRELSRILPQHSLLLPHDVGVHFAYRERGRTFLANALGKASHCMSLISNAYAVLSDDSGICVDALGGAPGVLSARFGRRRGVIDDQGRNVLLLKRLAMATRPCRRSVGDSHAKSTQIDADDSVISPSRAAHYVCAAVCIDQQQRIFTVQERWDGRIALVSSAGKGGFGYDPLFIPAESSVTVAEMSDEQKDRYSHRGKAFRALMSIVNESERARL